MQTLETSQIGLSPVIIEEKIKYCLYARKSTESDEKQALSIDSQIKEMLQIAERESEITLRLLIFEENHILQRIQGSDPYTRNFSKIYG